MKTPIETAALLLTIASMVIGCGKHESQPENQQTPPPTARQTPSIPDPRPQSKPVEVNAPQPADENKTYYVKRLEQSLSLKEINRRIQREELWPTDTYLEFPENQFGGTVVDGIEKPLSSVKGIAKFIKPSSPPWRRNVGDAVRWLKIVSPQMLVAVLSKSDPELGSSAPIYVLAGVDTASGDVLWRFELPSDYDFGKGDTGPYIQWFLSEPKLATVQMDFKKTHDLYKPNVWLPQVLAVNLESGKEAWRLPFAPKQLGVTIQKIEPNYLCVRGEGVLAYVEVTKGTLLAEGSVPPGANEASSAVPENPEWLVNRIVTDGAGVKYAVDGQFISARKGASKNKQSGGLQ